MNDKAHLRQPIRKYGFTLLELLVVLAIILVMVGLLLPATRSSTGAARRMSCGNNLKQIGLAMHNYHAAYNQLPMAMGGTGDGSTPFKSNENRLSGLVAMLPFMEQQKLWEQISKPTKFGKATYPAMGPAPWISAYTPWKTDIQSLRCASSPAKAIDFGLTNYTFCIGDMAREIHPPTVQRGVFACGMTTRFNDILDGTANTIAMTEIGSQLDSQVNGQFATQQPATFLNDPKLCSGLRDTKRPNFYSADTTLGQPGRGGRWADGAAGFSLVNTVLPPNSPSCAIEGTEAVDGLYSAGSLHQGGCHVLMADGAIKFITDNIDAGDQSQPTLTVEQLKDSAIPSPYGLWGSLGTATGKDSVLADF